MTPTKRLSFVAVSVLVLGVAFWLVRPDAHDPERAGTTAAAPAQQQATDAPAATTPGSGGPTATAPAASPRPAATQISVRGGAPVGGVQKVTVRQGDVVRLIVLSDQPDEVHVHGYDLEREVGPGAPARLRFTADADGVYEVELHESGNQIASLEVQPS
jgi:hypothetical protein